MTPIGRKILTDSKDALLQVERKKEMPKLISENKKNKNNKILHGKGWKEQENS